jgi:hypothetical protein
VVQYRPAATQSCTPLKDFWRRIANEAKRVRRRSRPIDPFVVAAHINKIALWRSFSTDC